MRRLCFGFSVLKTDMIYTWCPIWHLHYQSHLIHNCGCWCLCNPVVNLHMSAPSQRYPVKSRNGACFPGNACLLVVYFSVFIRIPKTRISTLHLNILFQSSYERSTWQQTILPHLPIYTWHNTHENKDESRYITVHCNTALHTTQE